VADAIPPQALSALIGSIYDCALDPSRWERALAGIGGALDSRGVILGLVNLRQNRFLLSKTAGVAPDEMRQLAKHLPEAETILGKAVASLPWRDEPAPASRYISAAYWDTSPYHQECFEPTGTVDTMHFFLMRTPTYHAGLGVRRDAQQGLITDREIALGKLLLPHLRRAVRIAKALDVRTIAGARMAEALDTLRCAVVLTNGDGAILHANHVAERMLRDGNGPIEDVRGVLQATAPSAAAELTAALALAAGNEAAIGKTGLTIRLTGPAAPPMFAHVLPLTGSDFRARLQPAAVAAVFIGAPLRAQEGAEAMAAAFGLTPAETRVLAGLFAGRSLAETAATLGVAGTTAKTHLEHIFLKTGAKRQAELMRLWTGTFSPARFSPAQADG
jgi:DNA-binding CsgD family transcriptional regulator